VASKRYRGRHAEKVSPCRAWFGGVQCPQLQFPPMRLVAQRSSRLPRNHAPMREPQLALPWLLSG
jgi:hypothetical protein